MTCKELLACLTKDMKMPRNSRVSGKWALNRISSYYNCPFLHLERNIDGKAFIYFTREDFSLIYPGNEKFLLSLGFHRRIAQVRRQIPRI